MKYISMLSGGQDSTAMTLRLLELGEPLDYIIFSDTGLEHSYMYEYIDKLDVFFQRKYNKKIVRLYPKHDFNYWVFGENSKGEHIGEIRGTPRVAYPCFWRRESKEYPLNRWLKENNINEFVKYIGYTSSETFRANNLDLYNYTAPLINWGWTESHVQEYLKLNHMENKLYNDFTRTGCSVCPKQTINDKYILWKKYPDVWEYMTDVENRLLKLKKERGEKISPAWHTDLYVSDMVKLFIKKSKQQTFDFDFEETRDCFCIF